MPLSSFKPAVTYQALIAGLLLAASCSSPQSPLRAPGQPVQVEAQGREMVSRILGDAPNFAASSNGELLTVVSSPVGRGAKTGALVELYWPDLGEDHLWDAYSGVAYEGKFYWLHQFKLESQTVQPDTDIIISRFVSPDGRLQAETRDLVLRKLPVHARNLTVTNRSQQPIKDLSVFFYAYLTANLFPTGDRCTYLPDAGAIHHGENAAHFVWGFDKAPAQFQCGGVKNLITRAKDAMHDAEDGKLNNNSTSAAGAGLGVNGSLATPVVTLAPGQSHSERTLLAAGSDRNAALAALTQARGQSWDNLVAENQSTWNQYLSGQVQPAGMSPDETAVYRRAQIVMKQHSVRTGAHIAGATSTSPPYRFSWPRDGSFIALAQLRSGHPEETRKFLDFMARNQKANGGWAINYHTNGQVFYDFGDRNNEHDQVGTIPWMMLEYARSTNDWSWLQSHWSGIKKACEFLIRYQDQRTGLMGPTRDLWELSTADSWTYSNAAAHAGLVAGAEAAERFGDAAAAAQFKTAAARMKTGIETYLWNEASGYFVRGYNLEGRRQDMKVEAANLALAWPFNVFPADDPRMVKMAQKIQKDLSSPMGGIRRYTGDRYYDGHSWPVTTDWLAIYYSRIGRADLAARLHAANTAFAFQTGSLQLGEQYDETQKRWVSANPLTWSGAKYVLSAIELRR